MRPAHRASRPRHLAGTPKPGWDPQEHELHEPDFDVAAALDQGSDFDFDALFAGDYDAVEPALPKVRPARHKIAFAVSVTIAALPFLVLDNFTANAEPPNREGVAATADAAKAQLDAVETTLADVPETTVSTLTEVQVTVPVATRFDPGPTTTIAAAPSTTTTAKPRPTTTTTAKPKPTTTTTAKPKPTTTTTAAAKALAQPAGGDPSSAATWDALAKCESGGNWQAVSEPRNGVQYYGGLQFALSSWQGLGGTGLPSQASKATQIEMGKRLQARQGWAAWPTCARRLGWIS